MFEVRLCGRHERLKLLLYISSADYDDLKLMIICILKTRAAFSMGVLENKLLLLSSQIHLCCMCLCSEYLDYYVATCAKTASISQETTRLQFVESRQYMLDVIVTAATIMCSYKSFTLYIKS
jgi:hypothetical protein